MPELPEVETLKRDLEILVGRRLERPDLPWPGAIGFPSPEEFRDRIAGHTITGLARRGKYILMRLSGDQTLVIQPKMTGRLLLGWPEDEPVRHTHALLPLDDGTVLRWSDQRKFGRLYLIDDDQINLILPFGRMGPEPLEAEFRREWLAQMLMGRSTKIKPLLLNQDAIAGIGNIYADETLFRAGIHPLRQAGCLSPDEIARLHAAIQMVLTEGVEHRGTTFDTHFHDVFGRAGTHYAFLRVYRREGHPCVECGTPIVKMVVAGRGTHFCPSCQPAITTERPQAAPVDAASGAV